MKHTSGLILGLCSVLAAFAQPKQMAVTIDDLPAQLAQHDSSTLLAMNQRLVGYLVDQDVPAIGFVNEGKLYRGKKLVGYRMEMLKYWASSGLELGNHTYSHLDYNNLEPAAFFSIVEQGSLVTRRLMVDAGLPYRYFRHPFLHRGNSADKVAALENYLNNTGYIEAPVTIDNSEWIFANAYDKAFKAGDAAMMTKTGEAYIAYMLDKTGFYERQSLKLFGRPIAHTLLIHANLLNADWLDDLLSAYRDQGYVFVTLADALSDPAYQSKDTFVGNAGISWIDRWAISRGEKGDFFEGEPRCPEFILTYTGLSE